MKHRSRLHKMPGLTEAQKSIVDHILMDKIKARQKVRYSTLSSLAWVRVQALIKVQRYLIKGQRYTSSYEDTLIEEKSYNVRRKRCASPPLILGLNQALCRRRCAAPTSCQRVAVRCTSVSV